MKQSGNREKQNGDEIPIFYEKWGAFGMLFYGMKYKHIEKQKAPHVELFERANLTERIGQGRQIQFGIGLQEIKQTPCDGLAAACPVAFDVDGDQRLVQG